MRSALKRAKPMLTPTSLPRSRGCTPSCVQRRDPPKRAVRLRSCVSRIAGKQRAGPELAASLEDFVNDSVQPAEHQIEGRQLLTCTRVD